MSNSSKPTKFADLYRLANQSTLNGAHVKEITKEITCFYESKKLLGCSMLIKTCELEKKQKKVKIYFRSTSKLISRVKEQQNCLWTTSYQMDFMKR